MTRFLTISFAVLGLVALIAGPARAVPNPTGDTYSFYSFNLPGDAVDLNDGPIDLTFDGIAEDVGTATVNEAYWPWDGGVIGGETIIGGDNPGNFVYEFQALAGWTNPGAIIELTIQNNIAGGGLHYNDIFDTAVYGVDGLDLNNGTAVPTLSTDGVYIYFTQGGVPVTFQTGKLFLDTDIYVGEHPKLPGVEVYYIDFAQSTIDNDLFFPYAGGYDFNTDVSREFGFPGAGLNYTDLIEAVGLNVFLGLDDPYLEIDGVGVGLMVQQESPAVVLTGDGNGDGWVDGLDYLLWASNFGDDPADDPPGSPGNGDYNGDLKVDGLDYLAWASNFGSHTVSTAVPEPGTFAMAGLALMGMLVSRRRRR